MHVLIIMTIILQIMECPVTNSVAAVVSYSKQSIQHNLSRSQYTLTCMSIFNYCHKHYIEYQSVQEGSESTETVYFDKRVFCHESQARYRIENVANDDSYGVSTDFYNAFSALPDVSITDTKDETNLEDYYDFLTRWGTVSY